MSKLRIHLVSLPHTQTTKAYSACAYTQKVRKFADMMTARGHEVMLYAGTQNEANVTEFVSCIDTLTQDMCGYKGPSDYLKIDFNNDPIWKPFVDEVVYQMHSRIQPKDIVCLITGEPFRPIMDAFPNNLVVEFGIGYPQTMAKYRVFESYAWMHYVYGRGGEDGSDFDAVIPNYFEPEDFPLGKQDGDYYLFIGRITDKKGYQIAIDVCQKLGKKLIIAGPGVIPKNPPKGVEYVGMVGPEERARLMGAAKAVFVPTQYVGPFEGVAVEAMMCGTPVITSDKGAFTEYVYDNSTGFRCRSFSDYLNAVRQIENPNNDLWANESIMYLAQAKFSTDKVAEKYERYFEKLLTLFDKGWYTEDEIGG